MYEQVCENGNLFMNEIQMQTDCEKNNLEEIYLLRSSLSEKNDEDIRLPQTEQIVKYQDGLSMTTKKNCPKLKDGVINTYDDTFSNSIITKYSCEKESLPEYTNTGKTQQLLDEIKEWCCLKESNDPIYKLLEQSRITICSLIEEIDTYSSALRNNQENFKCCSEKLNEEQQMSKNKDSEFCRTKTDLSLLADQHQQIIKHNLNCSNNKCIDLITKNIKLENDLKNEKNCNGKKAVYIDDLSKQIHNLETIIKGSEGHKLLLTEEISKLKNNECAAELKLNEFNSMIRTLKNELAVIKSELSCAQECLKNKKDCQIKKIQQLEHDNANLEEKVQFYNAQNAVLVNKCFLSDKELSESRTVIKSLETKINEIMKECKIEIEIISKECDNLKSENCHFLEKINELNESIICVNEKEKHMRKELITCNEKLSIANDEISILELEIKCVNTKLEKTTDKLACNKRELEETKLKLNKETHLKEKINEKYCSIKYVCSCPMEKCQTVDNNRLSDENCMSCKIARNVKETMHLKPVTQTHMCPAIYQPIITSTNCDSTFYSTLNNSNPLNSEQCDSNINNLRPCNDCNSCISPCNSDKISINSSNLDYKKMSLCVSPNDDCSCSNESKNTTKCFGFLFSKDNLQCQLNEMKLLFTKKEKATQKELCDTEQIYYNKEMIIKKCLDDTKEQYQKELDEANAQLETYETAILYKEYELKNYQIREHQFKMAMEQLNETIQIKNKKIECDQKQVVSAHNSLKDYEDQILNLQKMLELEKLKKHKSDENLQSLTENHNNQHEMVSELDNKLETSQTLNKKQQFSTRRNVNKSPCSMKISKSVKKTKRQKYGPILNLPCCIGSKNPCNRQKTLNKSQSKYPKAGYGVSSNNSETSNAEI